MNLEAERMGKEAVVDYLKCSLEIGMEKRRQTVKYFGEQLLPIFDPDKINFRR
jgi:hypothetical protein